MLPLRPVTARRGVVVVAPVVVCALTVPTSHGAAGADPLGSLVVGAATSVGAATAPIAGSVEALPSGSHGGSAAALDTGSDVGFGAAQAWDSSAGAPIGACAGPAPRVTTFGAAPPPVLGWTENMAFDDSGRLWVSKTFLNRVDAYDDDGNIIATASVRAPGGIDLGPDGRMHVAAGTGYLAQRSDVVSFDPSAGRPGEAIEAGAGAPIEVRVEARLDNRKNGLAVDAAGNRYLTSLEDDGLTKVRPDGTVDEEWSAAARLGVSNGIAISGDTAYVSQSTDRTVVHAVPLDAPGEWTTTELTAPPTMPRGLDDLAVTDEALLVTSWSSGEVYRIDRDSGEVCVLVGGIPRATSVVVADGFTGSGAESVPDGFDPGDLLVTSLHGPMRHVSLG